MPFGGLYMGNRKEERCFDFSLDCFSATFWDFIEPEPPEPSTSPLAKSAHPPKPKRRIVQAIGMIVVLIGDSGLDNFK